MWICNVYNNTQVTKESFFYNLYTVYGRPVMSSVHLINMNNQLPNKTYMFL